MIRYRYIFNLLVTLIICLTMITGPVSAMTIGEEREIGEKLLYSVRTQFSLLDDPDISQYINELGKEVLAQAGPRYFDYHFFVIPSSEFNAFAAPSGLIFFFSGLIETMRTENELISVMAHEIGHVVSRHIASRSDKGAKVSAISMALAMASLALGDPSLATGLFTGFQAAGQAANLHFSRADEEQADRLSYDWMNSLHRDPHAMEGMLRTMRRITRYRSGQIPQYLLTHPNPEARLEYVQSLLDYQSTEADPPSYTTIDNFDFLRMKYRVIVSVNDPQKARAYFSNALATGSSDDEKIMATYGLALLEARELNFTKALENIAHVRKYYPGRSLLDVDAGIMYLDSGEIQEAFEMLSDAYDADPYDMYATFNLARAYEKIGNQDMALEMYNKVMKNMPEYSKIYYEMGRIKANQGRGDESNFYLGKFYLYEGKMKFAREYLVKTTKSKTVSPEIKTEAESLLAKMDKLEDKS